MFRRLFHGRISITMRWIFNSLGVIMLIVLAVIIAAYFFVRTYYYGNARQYLTNRINNISGTLREYYSDTPTSFASNLHSMIENWNDRDKVEFMAVNDSGVVVMTSSGFDISSDILTQDYYDAVSTGTTSWYSGKAPSGEYIMAVTALTPDMGGQYRAVRLVTSMQLINSYIWGITFAVFVIGMIILAISAFSGVYFVKSIVIPVRKLENVARRYAEGDFSARITKETDDELGDLFDIVNHMAEELAMSDAMRNDFISGVSHELRTPLTAIKGWAETIGSMPEDKETVEKGMRVINNETERLSRMVEDLLDFSRMQNGKLTLNKASMDILAELGDAVLIYTERAKKDNITIEYDEPDMLPSVYGDSNRMRQVFINIIDNAIKYTDKGGTVSITANKKDDENIEIEISDTGCGISPQDLPKVKTKFYKANHTKRGSGIGLAIADEIISQHGGKLEIFSQEKKGTSVVITLPFEKKKNQGA